VDFADKYGSPQRLKLIAFFFSMSLSDLEKAYSREMVEELEQEYAALRYKVRDLQEYL
jgi:hypothetical protein